MSTLEKRKEEISLLDYFGVKSHSELMAFIQNNEEDLKVKELVDLMKMLESR